ncbi:MAG: 30S ribosomal protein S16 [Planctomycetes bacterium]|nr:30S ribosomal protein S16 [Planctomycetota bacterium]
MSVKLRLARFGRLNHPTYRICAAETRFQRDGRVIETLGYYLPKAKRAEEQSSLNAERISYWLAHGAQASDTVASLIKRHGIEMPKHTTRNKKRAAKTAPKFEPPHQLGNGRKSKAKWKAKHADKA